MNYPAYSREPNEVAVALKVDPESGLTLSEVERRREVHGWNRLAEVRGRSAIKLYLSQYASLVVALLGVAAAVAWLTGGLIEAVAIVFVLQINALIGFLMEWQAGQALEALRRQSRSMARVVREGVEKVIDAEELVPGDTVILHPGDRIPADLRVMQAVNLRTIESALTGESEPVEKTVEPVSSGTPLPERHSMLYLGTSIAAGRAVGLVTDTGPTTELGKIGTLVEGTQAETTTLRRRLDHLGQQLILLVLAIGASVVFAGWWRGDDLVVMLETGISLAVAAVPEGLPAVTTLILALGVLRMARSHAIVRHLPAVETLGSTTVICTDKTGTLTENRMVVREYRLSDGRVVSFEDQRLSPSSEVDPLWRRTVETAVLCNEASVGPDGETIGDPTETALLESALRLGFDVDRLRQQHPRMAEEPFDSQTRRMITIHRSPDGNCRAGLKGAPSVVLAMCSEIAFGIDESGQIQTTPLTAEMRESIERANDEMAGEALRVLAIAEKRLVNASVEQDKDYVFLGLAGLMDPPRAGVAAAIAQAYDAGIRVVMLTGDQLHTALAIARELKIGEAGHLQARSASDLSAVDSHQLAQLARTTQVFARVSPEDKLRIVEALKESGEVVAVTGDGVNDAPALKSADIGVAMGQRGTETARESADIVLTDDNFVTIIRAVEGGRTIYANIIKFVHLMLSANLSEVLFIFLAILLGWPLPLLPLQLLWINLVTDIFPALALAFEPPASDLMRQPPRARDRSMLTGSFFLLIGWQGLMLTVIALVFYGLALEKYGPGDHSRTIALFALIGGQLGQLFNCRSRTRSALEGLFHNRFLWLAVLLVITLQLIAVFLPLLATILGTVALDQSDLLAVIGSIFIPVIIVEAVKLVGRSRLSGRGPALLDV